MGDSKRTTNTILEAAERVILQSGLEKATIDEVAREAGVSKGGVLHHFPSKELMIVGLVQNLFATFETDLLARQAQDPEPAGSFTRAFLTTITNKENRRVEICFALHAAFRNIRQVEDLLLEASSGWQKRIENDGIDPVHASVVRLAADGLWKAMLHRVAVPSEKYRADVIEYLLALTRTPGAAEVAVKKKRG